MRVCTCRLEILARARFHGRQANSEWAHSNVCVRNALSTNSADWCAGTHAICAYYYCPPPIRPSSYRYYDRIQLHLNTLLACSVLPSFPGPCSRALFVQLEAGVCVLNKQANTSSCTVCIRLLTQTGHHIDTWSVWCSVGNQFVCSLAPCCTSSNLIHTHTLPVLMAN